MWLGAGVGAVDASHGLGWSGSIYHLALVVTRYDCLRS